MSLTSFSKCSATFIAALNALNSISLSSRCAAVRVVVHYNITHPLLLMFGLEKHFVPLESKKKKKQLRMSSFQR